MNLNSQAQTLRFALETAELKLAQATAAANPPLITAAELEIQQIQTQRTILDQQQKQLIFAAQLEMESGQHKVLRKLRQQSSDLQSRTPSLFKYRIHSLKAEPAKLAVRPDQPDIAPVYELEPNFKERQALHISWISEFQTQNLERQKWINLHQKKKDSCGASLKSERNAFREILIEGKSFWNR